MTESLRPSLLGPWTCVALASAGLVLGVAACGEPRPTSSPVDLTGGTAWPELDSSHEPATADISVSPVDAITPIGAVNAMALDESRDALWVATDGGVVRWDVQNLTHEVFTRADGLASNRVGDVAVGPDGTAWAGTGSGASHLGLDDRWTTYTEESGLASSEVNAVAVDAMGTVWFGTDGEFTDGGLSALTADGEWRKYTSEDGLPNNAVWGVEPDGVGGVWTAHASEMDPDPDETILGGVARWSPEGIEVVSRQHPRHSLGFPAIGVDADGRAWFVEERVEPAAADDSYDFLRVHQLVTVSPDGSRQADESEMATTAIGLDVTDIAFGPDGSAWMTDGFELVRRGPDGEWSWIDELVSEDVAEELWPVLFDLTAIEVAVDGTVWLGGRRGIAQLSPDGSTTMLGPDPAADGMLGSHVGRVVIDGSDNKWFADRDRMVRFSPDGLWTAHGLPDALGGGEVRAFAADAEGNLWVGTSSGAGRLSPEGHWATFDVADGLAGPVVTAIEVDAAGNVWFAMSLIEAEGGSTETEGWSYAPDEHGIGVGVSRLSPDGAWRTFTDDDGLGWNGVHLIEADDQGRVWFATNMGSDLQRGRLQGTGVSVVSADDKWADYQGVDGLASNLVRDIAVDSVGNTWFATDRGVSAVAEDGSWATFTTEDGLASNDVRAVAADDGGRVWFGSFPTWPSSVQGEEARGGLSVRTPDGAWRSFTTDDGLTGERALDVVLDASGDLWVGTAWGGVSVLRPE